jgi:hypothetical protein
MGYDNIARQVNMRLMRLAKFAGRDKPLLNTISGQLEVILDKENIHRFYKEKYLKENKPKSPNEVKTLNRRAEKYAKEKASVPAYEYRTNLDGGHILQIFRTAKLKDFIEHVGSALINKVPTTGQVKKQLANAGLEPTGENANKYVETMISFDDLMEIYKELDHTSETYQQIANIRNLAKSESRRPTYGEMGEMLAIYAESFNDED